MRHMLYGLKICIFSAPCIMPFVRCWT